MVSFPSLLASWPSEMNWHCLSLALAMVLCDVSALKLESQLVKTRSLQTVTRNKCFLHKLIFLGMYYCNRKQQAGNVCKIFHLRLIRNNLQPRDDLQTSFTVSKYPVQKK